MYAYTEGHSRIAGTGIYLPEERVTTRELMREIQSQERFGVSYEWLERVTGIKEKRVTPPGILPSDMAVAAAKEAMERAKVTAREIDAIIYTGLTRDYLEPATAHIVQAKLGATNAIVFDVSNACHGFMNGIHVMDALIATRQVNNGLVVTGEQGSVFTRRSLETLKKTTERDQFMCWAAGLTVGDAGAAVVLGPKVAPDTGIISFMLQSQGQHASLCTAGDTWTKGAWFADMTAIVAEAGALIKAMFDELMYRRLKWQIQDLTRCLIHQIGTGAFQIHKRLGVPSDIMPKTVDLLGNLITASIPLSIHRCATNREIGLGDKIFLSGQGSGISLSQAGVIWDCN
jgi:3-oxoacyl-(acyl-carrier-protein) synthase III